MWLLLFLEILGNVCIVIINTDFFKGEIIWKEWVTGEHLRTMQLTGHNTTSQPSQLSSGFISALVRTKIWIKEIIDRGSCNLPAEYY